MKRISLHGLLPEEIEEKLPIGTAPYRSAQLFRWVQKQRALSFDEMTNLPLAFRARAAEIFHLDLPEPAKRSESHRGGSEKTLFRFDDGASAETVVISAPDGDTLCVSSQAGCCYGCRFCATAIGGLIRSLRTSEIIAQFFALSKPPKRVVYMGMGEPLANFGNVVRSIRIITHTDGFALAPGRITVSTVGLVPLIDRLAKEKLGVRLAISLASADDGKRSDLMPVNRKYPVAELLGAAGRFARASGKPVTFEYPLLAGVNDGDDDARLLARKLGPIPCKVNLIPWNRVEELPFAPPDEKRIDRFLRVLSGRLTVTVRRSAGRSIDAACGQLRARANERRR